MNSQTFFSAIAVLISGSVLMIGIPAIFGVWGIAVIPVTAAAALIFFGHTTENILGIILASGILEFALALPLGPYPLAIAIAALVLMFASKVVRLEPLISARNLEAASMLGEVVVAYALSAFIFFAAYAVMALAYGYAWSWSTAVHGFFDGRVFFMTVSSIIFSWAGWWGVQHLSRIRRSQW